MLRTPRRLQELSPGRRLGGTLGIGRKKARSSEGAKESFERRAIKAARYSRMTISCDVAGFLPLLQSGPHFSLNTQGSAKPPPWAKFLYAFGVYSSRCRREWTLMDTDKRNLNCGLCNFFAISVFCRGYSVR